MTKERMGEIALLMMKAALWEHDKWDSEVSDEDVKEISQDTSISKEEIKEFFEKLFKEAGEERDGE